MISKLKIIHYRRLRDLELTFSEINAVSGSNGTCKTSILHLISNSFKRVPSNSKALKDSKVVKLINNLNTLVNPKIESLTKGDIAYNDPAPGTKGKLFSVTYSNNRELDFRRHNSTQQQIQRSRYAIKPMYKKGEHEELPFCPVIYLGLPRLIPVGEFDDNIFVKKITSALPAEYSKILSDLYSSFTHYQTQYQQTNDIQGIKKRAKFTTDVSGVDSNTISAGEDNLYIILTALVSLRYYFDMLYDSSSSTIHSVLLVDELDATLHPDFQTRLLQIIADYSSSYGIQVFFTTHSLNLLGQMFAKKFNVLYLMDEINKVTLMSEPSIEKIDLRLQNRTRKDLLGNKCIPIFLEDDEARLFLREIFDYFLGIQDSDFSRVYRIFHLPNIKIGADSLKSMFQDEKLLRQQLCSFAVLDGDKQANFSHHVLVLPGNDSPEKLFFKYIEKLFISDNSSFWEADDVMFEGYTKVWYRDHLQTAVQEQLDVTSYNRKEIKKLFNDNIEFFKFVIKYWVRDPSNQKELDKFKENLQRMYKKLSEGLNLDKNIWKNL